MAINGLWPPVRNWVNIHIFNELQGCFSITSTDMSQYILCPKMKWFLQNSDFIIMHVYSWLAGRNYHLIYQIEIEMDHGYLNGSKRFFTRFLLRTHNSTVERPPGVPSDNKPQSQHETLHKIYMPVKKYNHNNIMAIYYILDNILLDKAVRVHYVMIT